MKIVVTGSSGLIGRHLCRQLRVCHQVVGVDVTGEADCPTDVRDLPALTRAMEGAEAVIHLAHQASHQWEDLRDVCLQGTYNLFEAARHNGCPAVIVASSNQVTLGYEQEYGPALYDAPLATPMSSQLPAKPINAYGLAKQCQENMGKLYSETRGVPVTCIRIGSINREDSPLAPAPQLDGLPGWTLDHWRHRLRCTWMSQRDFHDLVRAVLRKPARYSVVYGVSDNRCRFWDLHEVCQQFDFWPQDGCR